jgi:multidrug efflux pump
MFTQLNQYRVVLEVMPEFPERPPRASVPGHPLVDRRQVPLNVFTQFSETTTPLVISRQGQFPSVTLSFNLARAIRSATPSRQSSRRGTHRPAS